MKIYIMAHKDYDFPRSEFFSTLGLGGYNSEKVDETDDYYTSNISNINGFYCELTGIHHVWKKNIKDEIVGICHYRRYFNFLRIVINHEVINGSFKAKMSEGIKKIIQSEKQIATSKKILETYDLIVPKAHYSSVNIGVDYSYHHSQDEWEVFLSVMEKRWKDVRFVAEHEKRNFYFNMILCKRRVFDLYCEQLFPIMEECFLKMGGEGKSTPRFPGYLAERFMVFFIIMNKLVYYESDIIFTE